MATSKLNPNACRRRITWRRTSPTSGGTSSAPLPGSVKTGSASATPMWTTSISTSTPTLSPAKLLSTRIDLSIMSLKANARTDVRWSRYKVAVDAEDGRRRREENMVEIRRNKREENLHKKRRYLV
nr:importin subunit alpha-like [Ipomoea batatas]